MDDDTLPADESEEEFRKMEKDIDEFLTSIRENVSKNTDPQSEATCSRVSHDYDSISSDDFDEESNYHSLHSRSDEPDFLGHSRKVNYNSSLNKNRLGWRQWKGRGVHKQRRCSFREEEHSNGGRGCRQRELSSSGDKYYQYKRQSSSRRDDDYPQEVFSPRGEDEYTWPLSPRGRDEFHQERSLSPRESAYHHGRSISPREQDEYYESSSISPEGKVDHQRERLYSRERYVFERREFSPEGIEEHSQDSFVFNEENISHKRTSRSSETESIYHRLYAEESDSPTYWSESHDNDYGDQNSNPYWKHEGGDPFMEEDEDGQSSSAGIMSTSSVITACLEKVIAVNPEIAKKFTKACMSLLNKSVDRTCDEYEESSCASFGDQAGRVSPRSWRGSRSPSFLESLGSFSGPSGPRHYRNRYESHSQRIDVDRSHSHSPEAGHSSDNRLKEAKFSSDDKKRPTAATLQEFNTRKRYESHSQRIDVDRSHSHSPEAGHSSDNRLKEAKFSSDDKKRPTAATLQEFNTRKRSSSKYHKNYYEEDPKTSVTRSIRKIGKQCEEESDSTVRRALLALLEVHERECDMYLRKPEAHPDYNKEYRVFLDKKTKSIIDLGGDPNDYDFQEEWKKYWPSQMSRVFRESWDAKMRKCTFMLQRKGHVSKSLHASSRNSTINQHPKKKQKLSKQGSEKVNTEKSHKKSEKVKDLKEQKDSEAASITQCMEKKEQMDTEILSILKLLNHIKHRFKDFEVSFDTFYQKALSLNQKNFDLHDILQSNLPLLEKIDENLKETLKDENLTLIQKAIIQETHERFRCFLKKSKDINSTSMKNNDNTEGKAMKMTDACMKIKISEKNSNIARKVPVTSMSSATVIDEKSLIDAEEEHKIPCHVTDLHAAVDISLHTEQVTTSSYASCKCYDTNLQLCRPKRTLTEVSLQGSSCTASAAPDKPNIFYAWPGSFEYRKKQNGEGTSVSSFPSAKRQDGNQSTCQSGTISVEKDSDMTQPPPPGVTPPPPGVTPPPLGATPPPLSVTLPSTVSVISPPPFSVTPPPPGVTPPPLSVTLPSSVVPPSHNITSPPSSTTPSPHSVKSSPRSIIPSPSAIRSTPLNITEPSGVTPPPPGVTPPPPGVTPPPVSVALQSSVSTLSQVSFSGSQLFPLDVSQSPLVSNLQISSNATSDGPHHPSTISTSVVQNNKSLKEKDIVSTSKTQMVQQPSKEFLRSTIKDCFLSATSPSEGGSVSTSTAEEPILDNKAEESAISSVPSLPEDILRMFVVKPEDKSEINANNKSSTTVNSSGNQAENDIKPSTKKPIKITIPQFRKQKSMPAFSPAVDDQELL